MCLHACVRLCFNACTRVCICVSAGGRVRAYHAYVSFIWLQVFGQRALFKLHSKTFIFNPPVSGNFRVRRHMSCFVFTGGPKVTISKRKQ